MKLIAIISPLLFWAQTQGFKPNPAPVMRHRFIIVAHRGDHVVYPENTLAAYGQAIKSDLDYVEIDLRTTKDGRLVSMHDASVDRMTNGKGLVKDLTFQQVESLQVKSKNSSDTVFYHVPTFEQILKLCRNRIYIYIDFKEAAAAQTLAMLKQYGMEKQVLVYINKPSQFTDWRKTDPRMPLMVSLPDTVKNVASMRSFIEEYHPDILDGDYSDYNAAMLACAKSFGMQVWPDGESASEGPAVWAKAVALGLNGLQSDHPEAFAQYLKQKGLR